MPRPPKKEFSLRERLERIRRSGLNPPHTPAGPPDELAPLTDRIRSILGILKDKPAKATTMTYLIMYDISDDRVRLQIAKYLERQGCVRIQKSVFLAHSENKHFQDIYQTLKDVNDCYENEDSIILVPVNSSDVRSMKLIGKNIDIQAITDKPNTLFF